MRKEAVPRSRRDGITIIITITSRSEDSAFGLCGSWGGGRPAGTHAGGAREAGVGWFCSCKGSGGRRKERAGDARWLGVGSGVGGERIEPEGTTFEAGFGPGDPSSARARDCMRPFQIIFNPTSAAELARMPKELQLQILGNFRGLPLEVMSTDLEQYGRMERNGRTLHRFRIGDYRVYFERHELGVVVHRILNRNTLKDFLFRSSLPTGEDGVLQENPKFWELIEAARGARG